MVRRSKRPARTTNRSKTRPRTETVGRNLNILFKPVNWKTWERGRRTLLHDYIAGKIRNYIKPVRKGKRRGNAIGIIHPKKFVAALFALTTKSVTEQAQGLSVEYHLFKKWRAEPGFKRLVQTHAREFAQIFLNRVRERVEEQEGLDTEFLRRRIGELSASPLPSLDYTEFADIRSYHPVIWESVMQSLRALGSVSDGSPRDRYKAAASRMELFRVCDLWLESVGEKPVFKELFQKCESDTVGSVLSLVISELQKPSLTQHDRKKCIHLLLLVNKSLAVTAKSSLSESAESSKQNRRNARGGQNYG